MIVRVDAEVAVIGGGPAGLAAAVHAAEGGRTVVLVERARAMGGQIWRSGAGTPMPRAARRWAARLARANVRVIADAEVVDAVPLEGLTAVTSEGSVRIRAPEIVLATGARELFLPFPGWVLPNVMGVGGLQALVKSGYDVRGKRVVIAGSGPLLLPVAAALAARGAQLVIVAEQTPREQLNAFARSLWRAPWQLAEAAWLRAGFLRTPYRAGTWVTRAGGDGAVREVTLTDGRREWQEACDVLACGYGLVPNTELARLLGCAVDAHGIIAHGDQATTVRGVFAAGECAGGAGRTRRARVGVAAAHRRGRRCPRRRCSLVSRPPRRGLRAAPRAPRARGRGGHALPVRGCAMRRGGRRARRARGEAARARGHGCMPRPRVRRGAGVAARLAGGHGARAAAARDGGHAGRVRRRRRVTALPTAGHTGTFHQ
jgi:thioredoxin reductase